MIQDITGKYHNEYKNPMPQAEDYIMFVDGRSVLLKSEEGKITFIKYAQWKEWKVGSELRYLFMIEIDGKQVQFFLGDRQDIPADVLEEYHFDNHNIFREALPKEMRFAGVTACQLANWYANTRFCGHCGNKLVHDEKERMMKCPSCKSMHYPKISPAVIIAVTDGDRILMTKYAGRDYKKYALVAGFTEIGETLEETVAREVYEEVGLKVKNIRYYKSQPWSFSDTLLMGFYCELDGDDQIRLDQEELSVGEWIKREEIQAEFDDISLTNEMIIQFKEGKQ